MEAIAEATSKKVKKCERDHEIKKLPYAMCISDIHEFYY